MKAKQPIQISIPSPCHENWEGMTAVEKCRFCAVHFGVRIFAFTTLFMLFVSVTYAQLVSPNYNEGTQSEKVWKEDSIRKDGANPTPPYYSIDGLDVTYTNPSRSFLYRLLHPFEKARMRRKFRKMAGPLRQNTSTGINFEQLD